MKRREEIALLAPYGCVGAELGVANGDLTHRFLDLDHFSEFHAVDKWDDHHSIHEYHRVIERLADYEELQIWRQPASTWLSSIPDNTFGFIYIDCYAHTGQDDGAILRAAWPKLADGGVFSGDDYDTAFPLTIRAVDRFAESVGHSVRKYTGFRRSQPYDNHDSWFYVKSKAGQSVDNQ